MYTIFIIERSKSRETDRQTDRERQRDRSKTCVVANLDYI